ncbi:YceI family protein [Aequorivita marisscotiae]|uniref:YceI family protein n=1 Tax=Aequorivita marisscotiae TaxID=3040348 RepID=A0ABY8KV19_9FLAO|nr:YceI family protein [Aequorivita sp. Ant34-E75]WGF92996.1 YceI family protein [Aequorivita sp. Ant34-E75]
MKTTITFAIICFAFIVSAIGQEKYTTKTGQIDFEASVPSFEEVKAANSNVSAVLDASTGKFAALALMKGFRFKVALMEEHFNENYIESSKYPKATFKGIIQDFDISEISGKSDYSIKGTFNMHGTDKEMEVPAVISVNGDTVMLTAQFVMQPEDFNIKIPSIVSNKIAEDVNVFAEFSLQKQ